MSRIFDALQRSGVEQSGVEYPDMVSVATKVFEEPGDHAFTEVGRRKQPSTISPPGTDDSVDEAPEQEPAIGSLAGFPSREIAATPSSRLVFLTEPESLAAEKFRFLGVRLRQLRQSRPTRPLKKVLITSTIPEEGKSLVSANLAGVLARRKQNVLLIEGDLRRPVLSQRFGLGKLPGLADWLQGGMATVSNIYHLAAPGFWFMPAGDAPANSLELMQSGRLSQLMEQLTALFDWVIVDSPPLLPLADTTVWARLTDGVLLVVRQGTTQKAPLERGLEILKKGDLLGVVLNSSSDGNHYNYYERYAAEKSKRKE